MENTNLESFTNVRVFAGDKSKPAADASYRNLLWENFRFDHVLTTVPHSIDSWGPLDVGIKIERNKQIGIIDNWGPFFRVSFDLKIHSFVEGKDEGDGFRQMSSLLAFKGNGAITRNRIGDRIPVLLLDNELGMIYFYNFIDSQSDYYLEYIDLDHWYNIIIEQKSVNGKVIN